MKAAERQTRSHLMKLFKQHGFYPRTDLGQNFLIDLNIVEFIVRQADLGPDDVVLEIGTGTGGMTAFLAREAAAAVSVEVDRRMFQLAQEVVGDLENVTLLRCDALRNKNQFSSTVLEAVEQRLDEAPGRRLKLVSNLPYNIATPVVSNLAATDLPWDKMVVTIQLELAERMTAAPRTPDYGALSVWLQSQCRVRILKVLKPTVFWPRPKVRSAVVQVVPDENRRRAIRDRRFFQNFLRRLFHHRRKLLRSVLVGMYRKQLEKPEIDAILGSMNLGANTRAEELDPGVFVELANRIRAALDVAEKVPQQQQ